MDCLQRPDLSKLAAAAFLAVLLASPATAQEPPGLPWTITDPNAVIDSETIARGLVGTPFAAAPDLSPALPGEPPLTVMDARDPSSPLALDGGIDAAVIGLYWRAQALSEDGQYARAGTLLQIAAPWVPGAGARLTLDAAEAFARGGELDAAEAALGAAVEAGIAADETQPARALIAVGRGQVKDAMAAFAAHLGDAEHGSAESCGLGVVVSEGLARSPSGTIEGANPDNKGLRAFRRLPSLCANSPEADRINAALKRFSGRLGPKHRAALIPGTAEKLLRARRHLEVAENDDARQLLDGLIKGGLAKGPLACEVPFRMARALRAMKRNGETRQYYEQAMRGCTKEVAALSPELRVLRTRSLYWTGMRAIKSGDRKTARIAFEAIAREVPKARHADDAFFHLAAISRTEGKRKEAAELRARLISDYPAGDMTRQAVWEPIFAHLKEARWAKARDALQIATAMPPDPTYYGQGRWHYYLGYAHWQLGAKAKASEAWKLAWSRNPTAFYGHLSAQSLLRLKKAGAWIDALPRPSKADPVPFEVRNDAVRGWILLGDFRRAGRAVLAEARKDGAEPSVHDLWLGAYLLHLAGDYEFSHNIARRKIPGFPQAYGLPTAQTRLLFEIGYPDPYKRLVEHWSSDRGVSPFLVRAIMREESGFVRRQISWAGAIGLMQLILPTARGHAKGIDVDITREALTRPEINLPIATRFMGRLYKMLGDHPVLLACGYNAGPGAPRKWLGERSGWDTGLFAEAVPYSEARNYSRRVTGSYGFYQWQWGSEGLAVWDLEVNGKAR